MERGVSFAVAALGLTVAAGLAQAQDADSRNDGDLNVSIGLEAASQSGAAAANLQLPAGQGTRPAPSAEPGPRFQPADFARPNRLEALRIAADDLPRGASAGAVRCQAFVGRDGGLGDYYCFSNYNRNVRRLGIVDAVMRAVPTQQFVAARVDGASVRVLMSFAVYFDCGSGSCVAVTGRNHGYDIEQLGLDYVAPQPILESDAWYDGFDYKLRWVKDWMLRIENTRRWTYDDEMPYVMAAEVDAGGIAAPACLSWVVGSGDVPWPYTQPRGAPLLPPPTIRDLERALATFGNVRFVPGMLDGTPTALRVYEHSVARYRPTRPFQDTPQSSDVRFGVGDIACK